MFGFAFCDLAWILMILVLIWLFGVDYGAFCEDFCDLAWVLLIWVLHFCYLVWTLSFRFGIFVIRH